MKKNLYSLQKFILVTIFSLASVLGWGQSYLGLDGGFEGAATIDNTNTFSAPQTGKWSKANTSQTIANEISTVRSGANALRVNNTATGRRVWSPNIALASTTTNVTVQFYLRVASTTNGQEVQQGIQNNTEGLQGSYSTGSAANTWTKVTYTKASSTFTSVAGLFLHRQKGTGGDMFIDDMAVYAGGADTTAPNSPSLPVFSGQTTTTIPVSWTAASGGVDGGGYLVVRGTTDPTTVPNVNGIYASGNTIAAGMTVVYQGTGTSFTDTGLNPGTTYYYRIYTYDKAYNYSSALAGNSSTLSSTFTVTFDANGATSGSMSNQTASTPTNLTANAFLRTGYTFTGWATTAGGTVAYTDGASYPFTANATLYAVWTPNNNTITFDGNGATGGSTGTQTIATAASANLTSNGYSRTGYTFAGWATTAGGAVAYADGASYTMGTSNVTLYAQWTPNNNTITFDGNGATSGSMGTQTIATAATANLTSNGYSRTGYTFAGWATTAGGAVAYADGASYTMGTSDVTLYAQWTINSYNVFYNGNGSDGGTAPVTQSGNYNTSLTISDKGTLTRSGFNFNGWNTASNGSGTSYAAGASYTVPTNDITLYAQWQTSGGVNGNIDADEYGTGNGQHQGSWYMKSDATNLYIGISGANLSEGAVVYLDKDANVPVNSGTGIKTGNNYDGSSFSELPFNADLVVYFKNGYQEYRTVSGSSWGGAVTSGMSYASDGGTSTREIAIPWSAIGGQPAKYNWLGYVTSSGGYVYSQVPSANPSGNIGTSANWNYYYTVVSATAPFTNTSYTFTGGSDVNSFGPISVYDLTMNSSGRWLSRSGGTNGAWNIGNDLVVGAGNIYLGSGANPTNISGNLNMLGGYLDNGNVTSPISITNNITLASGASLKLSGTAGGDLIVGGNWSNSGTFNPSGRAVTFNGSGTQTITNASGENFNYLINDKSAGNLVFANNVTVNGGTGDVFQLLNGTIDLNGKNLTLSGTGGNIKISGSKTLNSTVAGSIFNITNGLKTVTNGNLTIPSNVTTVLNSGLDFGNNLTTIQGVLRIESGGYAQNNAPIYANTSTLEYKGVTGYGVFTEWTNNSSTAGNGVPQNVLLTNSSVNLPNSHRGLAGNLTIESGSILNLNGTSGDLYIAGNWINSGTFNSNNRAIFFNGGVAQTLTGATTFDWLLLDNTAGLTLNNDVTVNNTLTLTAGKITLGTNNLTINGISGASTSNYVVTNSTGQLKRSVGASATVFPVGNSSYNPITFNNSGTSDVYGVRVIDGAITTGYNNTKTVNRSWVTTEAVPGGSNLSVIAQYNSGEENTNFNAGTTPKIGLYDGSAWTEVTATAAGANPYTYTSDSNLSATNLNGSQYFAIGKDDAFIIIKHDVIFDANGGTGTMANQSITWGATTNLNANTFTRAGYTFTGWATTPSGTVAYADSAPFTMGSSNVTLYAVWAATSHTITFNANGGTGTMSNQTANISTAITLNSFARTGYTFAGWATSAGGAVVYTDGQSYDFSADITLYANWTPNNNTITFDANGGTGTMSNQIIATGATASLDANAFTRAGYTFAGWAITAGGAVAYADAASYTMGTGNVTLYAKWTANNYNVIFNANGGTGSMSNQVIASGSSAALTTNTFTRAGYVFSGWNTLANGSGTSYADGASYTMSTSDVTLYAQWTLVKKYILVSSESELITGKKYLIVNANTASTAKKALSNQQTNYRIQSSDVTVTSGSPNYINTPFATSNSSVLPFEITIQAGSDGTHYYLYDGVNNTYLIPSTGSGANNYLNGQATPSDWTITFTSGKAVITNTGNPNTNASPRNILSYNSGATRYACYSSEQAPVYLYVEESTDPTITVTPTAALSLGTTICQGSSGTGNYTVKGTNLTNDIVITPPANIEISTDNSTWVTTPVTLTQTGGNVATTTIYVRSSNALGAGAFSGTITHTSTGATTINKSITGTVIASQTPTATVGTSSTSVCNGSSVTLTATPSNVGGGTVTYQWYKNSSIASGATNSTFTDTVTADSSYYCEITIAGGCVTTSTATSNTVSVTAIALPSAPASPTITTICNQATASAVTSVEGTVYWETSSSGILETTSADNPRVFTTAGTYYLRVKNASGCWSPSTTVTITFPSLSITANVADVSATVGNNATFSVTSPDAVSYQWEQSTDGGSSWSPIPSATSSSYTVSGVTLGMSGYKYHVILTGTAPCTTTTSAVGTLTVTTFTSGDYRTTSDGTWITTGSTSTWEQFDGSSWGSIAAPATNTTKNVYIRNNISMSSGTNTAGNVIVESGGILTTTISSTFGNLLVKTGGTFNREGNGSGVSGTFEVQDGGLVTIKHTNTTSYATTIWAGTEKFHPNSTFKIVTVDATAVPLIAASNTISDYTESGVTALFGNLIIDCSTGKLQLVYSGFNAQLTAKDLIFRNNSNNTALSAGNITTTIGGNLIIENTYNQAVNFSSAASSTVNVTVKGDLIHNSTVAFRPTTSLNTNSSFTVEGNLSVTGGGIFLPNGGSGALTGTSVVNLKGNLAVSSSSSLTSTATGTNTFNFIGTTGTQTIDVANTTSVAQIAFVANNGSYVKLINQDLAMGTNSSFTVKNLATLDFGFNGTTGLNLLKVGVQTGQSFNAQAGSTLKITSVDGISNGTGVYTGNVQIGADATKRIFDAGATYHYIGKANQISGNGLPADLSSKVIVELDTDALTFQPNGSNTITSSGTLEIRKGIVLDNGTGSFKDATSATANLTMSGGRLQLYRTGTMPDLSGDYNLTAGVVEFANTNASAQTIRTKSYQNIEVTGNNVGNSSGNITIQDDGSFTVKNGGVFSINANSIVGTSGTQTVTVENGGTFKTGDVDGFSGTAQTSIQPSIENIVLADGSTVEYTRADANQTITEFNTLPATPNAGDYSTKGYYNLKISGDNTANTTTKMVTGTSVYVRNNLDVVTPAIFTIGKDKAITVNNNITSAGDANFIVESDGNLLQINPAAINTGNITSKREAVMRRLYYTYWSSSVAGQILKDFSPGTLNSRFYTYKESDDTFLTVADPTTTPFTKGKGYAIRASNAAASTDYTFVGTFKGTPNNGNITIGLDYTDDAHGYNMIGNPYPSNIDFDKLFTNNSGSIYHTAYFWTNVNPNPSSQGSSYLGDNYAIYTGAGGVDGASTTSVGSNNPTKYISVGQGFIVKAKNGSSVNYTNDIRTSTAGNFINKKADDTNRYWVKLISPVGNVNTILLAYMSDATNDIDNDYDAERLVIGSDAFYSLVDNKKLGIQARSYPLDPSDVVDLGTKHAENGNYTISLTNKEGIFANGQSIYLHDKILGTYTDLQQGDYSFSAGQGENNDRFEITYKPGGTLGTDNGVVKSLVVYTKDQNYVIESPEKVLEVKLIDASGKLISTLAPHKNKVLIDNTTLTNGVYVLQIRTPSGVTVKKVMK